MSIKDLFDKGHSLKFVKNKTKNDLASGVESPLYTMYILKIEGYTGVDLPPHQTLLVWASRRVLQHCYKKDISNAI